MYAISPQLLTQEATSNGHFYVEIWLLSWPLLQEQWKFRIKCYIAPLQVLGTRLVQADSYPTWFENVAVVAVESRPSNSRWRDASSGAMNMRASMCMPLVVIAAPKKQR